MAHRFDSQHCTTLLSSRREAKWQPRRFLARFELHPGDTVLDVGCGPGFWTFPLAEWVGSPGVVYALDVSREMLTALAQRDPPPQVHRVQAELPGLPLVAHTVDFVWASAVFHEVDDLQAAAGAIAHVLRPGGRVGVLDWRPDPAGPGRHGPPLSHRVSPRTVEGALRAAGFVGADQTWEDEDDYLVEAHVPAPR